MPRWGYLRPIICLVLAVSTALSIMPANACACPSPVAAKPAPEQSEKPKTMPCCELCTMHCCSEPPAPAPSSDEKSCQCLLCQCDSPAVPNDAAPPQAPTDSSSLQFVSAPPVPPVVLTLSDAVNPRSSEAHADPPPPDLVILLERLTC